MNLELLEGDYFIYKIVMIGENSVFYFFVNYLYVGNIIM